MKYPSKSTFAQVTVSVAALIACFVIYHQDLVYGAGGPVESQHSGYRVLAPIESGNLLLFPVVQSGKMPGGPFITLDEGIKSGDVEVTEAGRVRGLVRSRPAQNRGPVDGTARPALEHRGDQVNTLVLVNNSNKPLLLLAGEIVTGGKQDRVIAKDRIVPAGSDAIDLGVFCIEPGRWTEDTASFRASAKTSAQSIMVQPTVREKAMVAKDQHQVWDSVHGAIGAALQAPAPSSAGAAGYTPDLTNIGTTSYVRAMQNSALSAKVDEAAAPLSKSGEQILDQLRQEHAVGVVVAIRGEIVWADMFSSTDLLTRYWTKLVRSYAAESLADGQQHSVPTISDAQHFLDVPAGGTETSFGDVGVYRYRELRSGGTETFVLESLLPGTGYDVHVSRLKLTGEARRTSSQVILR
jgi:hypothetical protein